jgi:hypothetical protein
LPRSFRSAAPLTPLSATLKAKIAACFNYDLNANLVAFMTKAAEAWSYFRWLPLWCVLVLLCFVILDRIDHPNKHVNPNEVFGGELTPLNMLVVPWFVCGFLLDEPHNLLEWIFTLIGLGYLLSLLGFFACLDATYISLIGRNSRDYQTGFFFGISTWWIGLPLILASCALVYHIVVGVARLMKQLL